MSRIRLENIKNDKNFLDAMGINEEVEFKLLGQGEYNMNYLFYNKNMGKNLVLRIATDSQMKLDHQIEYEFHALKILEKSQRTPKALYVDGTKEQIPYGFLVMEYLPGKPLDYKNDMSLAVECLADIHNTSLADNTHLLTPENPIQSIYEECLTMFEKYRNYEYADLATKRTIEKLLKIGSKIKEGNIGKRTIINTELNSGNFLINGKGQKNYLIDWEKPLYGYAAQDLGHFLAPTTTFWKTDYILSSEEIRVFIEDYTLLSNQYHDPKELWQSVKNYIAMNCLRGVTWCAMAYVEYQNPDKLIVNNDTYEKIKAYLSNDFLKLIESEYLNECK